MEEGEKIGIEKGKLEVAHEKALVTARNLFSMGLSVDQISKATELTGAEVLAVQKELEQATVAQQTIDNADDSNADDSTRATKKHVA